MNNNHKRRTPIAAAVAAASPQHRSSSSKNNQHHHKALRSLNQCGNGNSNNNNNRMMLVTTIFVVAYLVASLLNTSRLIAQTSSASTTTSSLSLQQHQQQQPHQHAAALRRHHQNILKKNQWNNNHRNNRMPSSPPPPPPPLREANPNGNNQNNNHHPQDKKEEVPEVYDDDNVDHLVAAAAAAAAAAAKDSSEQPDDNNAQSLQSQYTLPGRHPIFYNFYVPSDASPDNAVRIGLEQMATRRVLARHAPVYITWIGTKGTNGTNDTNGTNYSSGSLLTDTIQCDAPCTIRAHLKIGNEVDTHQALWEYCQHHHHHHARGRHETNFEVVVNDSEEWVTYIHDKGSHHPNRGNEQARRVATQAVLQCRRKLALHNGAGLTLMSASETNVAATCNACGAMFNLLPQYQMNANMWTLPCSYVRQLYEPRHYAAIMERMYQDTLLHPDHANTTFACLQPQNFAQLNHVGLGRFAAERWALSHPSVVPCSSIPRELTLNKIQRKHAHPHKVVWWKPILTREPRKGAGQSGLQYSKFQTSFARLQGRLHEWQYVYNNATPPSDSWIWNYYRQYQKGSEKHLQSCQAAKEAFEAEMLSLNEQRQKGEKEMEMPNINPNENHNDKEEAENDGDAQDGDGGDEYYYNQDGGWDGNGDGGDYYDEVGEGDGDEGVAENY